MQTGFRRDDEAFNRPEDADSVFSKYGGDLRNDPYQGEIQQANS